MNSYYSANIVDSNDGSGDGILTFDPQMLIDLDWKEGDKLSLKVSNGTIIFFNKTKELRDRKESKK